MPSKLYVITHQSICLYVRLSHGWITVEVRIMQLSPQSSPISLNFCI